MASLIDQTESPRGINLEPDAPQPVISPERLSQQAEEANYALGDKSPGLDAVSAYFFTGNQDALRKQASLQTAIEDRQRRQALVQQTLNQAAQTGKAPSIDDYELIRRLSQEELQATDKTILEHMYAHRLLSDAVVNTGKVVPAWDQAYTEDSDRAQQTFSGISSIIAKQQLAKKTFDDLKTKYDASGFFDRAYDFVRGFVPFANNYIQTKDQIPGIDNSINPILDPGGHLAAEYRGLMLLPPEEFEKALAAKVDALVKSGQTTQDAMQWVSGLLNYTGTDQIWTGIYQAGDATILLPGVSKMLNVGKQLVKANVRELPSVSRMALTGDTAGAARTKAFQRLDSKLTVDPQFNPVTKAPTPVGQVDALMAQGQGILDPKPFFRDVGSMTNERAARLLDAVSNDNKLLLSTMKDLSHLTRINEPAFIEGAYKAEKNFYKLYPKLEDSVIEIQPVRESNEAFGGVDRIDIYLGKGGDGGALPFKTESNAKYTAEKMYRLPAGSYDIAQAGDSYLIRIKKHIDETDLKLGDTRIQTDNRNPETLANRFLGYMRSADYTTSKSITAKRKVATYGGEAMLRRIRQVAQSIPKLSQGELKDLKTVIDHARFNTQTINTAAGPQVVQGKFFNTLGELEQEYIQRFNRRPSENEAHAYYTFKAISDLEDLQRNVSVLRDKNRLGIERRTISVSLPDEKTGKSLYRTSGQFEARVVDALPDASKGDYGVVWISPKTGQPKFNVRSLLKGYEYKELSELIASGDAKVLQLADPFDPVLRGWKVKGQVVTKNEPVHFVVARDVKSYGLADRQVPRREGGGWNYPQNNSYVKQPRTYFSGLGRRIYTGDTTHSTFTIHAQAVKIAESMEKARLMLVEGRSEREITDFVSQNLPYADADEFRALFKTPGVETDAPFDLHSPFVVTRSGQRVADAIKLEDVFREKPIDSFNHPYSLQPKIGSTRYPGQVGQTVRETEVNGVPHYNLEQAQVLDPMETLQRTAARLAKDRYYEDYKHTAIEDWIQQFSDTLEGDNATLRANPMKHLLEPKWRAQYPDKKKLAAAKNARRSILTTLGQDTYDALTWKAFRQTVIDSIYDVKGQKSAEILDPYLWPQGSPVETMRSAVYHAKIGLFNPIQLFAQAAGVVHIAALTGNPTRAAKGIYAGWAMRMRDLVPDAHWETMGGRIGKALGIPKDVADEMYSAWKASGMDQTGGEYGLLDQALNPRLFENAVSKALDAGTLFFKEGNNIHRNGAFATAYLEWREANPLAKLMAQDMQNIVDRADLMYINMTRASNAPFQAGPLSIPAQFFGYHIRMNEQMLSKRLSVGEWARVMTAYSLMWGVPVGVLGTTVGSMWPVYDSFRQYALEHGIDTDTDMLAKGLSEGIGSMIVDYMAHENMDAANRFGPGGMSWLRDLFENGPLSMQSFGAGPNFIANTLATTMPFYHAAMSVFNTNPDQAYNLKPEDFTDVLKGVTTFNNLTRAYAIYNAGEWLSKSQGVIANGFKEGDWSTTVAVALGLTPQKVTDAYLMLQSNDQLTQAKNAIAKEVQTNFARGMKYAVAGDEKNMAEFFARARWLMIAGGFTPLEQAAQFSRAAKANGSMFDDVAREFMLGDPDARKQQYSNKMMQELNNG